MTACSAEIEGREEGRREEGREREGGRREGGREQGRKGYIYIYNNTHLQMHCEFVELTSFTDTEMSS